MEAVDKIISSIIEREGGFNDRPEDKGGPTCWGIAKRWHPEAWLNGPPTREAAAAIYRTRYILAPGFDKIKDTHLQAQLIDFGVNSGTAVAIKALQRVVGLPEDGVIGPQTTEFVNANGATWVNNELMCERLRMFGRIVQRDKSQVVFIAGWINRATDFLI